MPFKPATRERKTTINQRIALMCFGYDPTVISYWSFKKANEAIKSGWEDRRRVQEQERKRALADVAAWDEDEFGYPLVCDWFDEF